MTLTAFLATWGAIISTAALTWNIVRDSRDRARLKLEAMIGRMYPDHADRVYLVVTMTNIGRRPVLVKGWGAERRQRPDQKTGLLVKPRGLPRMLNEGEYHIEYTHDFTILEKDVKRIYVYDSSGREWNLSRRQLRSLRSDLTKPES